MGKSKISMTFDELVAVYNSWWEDYKADPSTSVDYDAVGYDDTTYGVDAANTFMKHFNKIQGE